MPGSFISLLQNGCNLDYRAPRGVGSALNALLKRNFVAGVLMMLEAGCDSRILRERYEANDWPRCLTDEPIKSQILNYVMQPGCLKHLSRLAFREKLKNKIKLKISSQNGIPDLLKDYIIFKHFEQYMPENTAKENSA